MISEPGLGERAEQPYVAIRTTVPVHDLGGTIRPLLAEVYTWLGAHGVPPSGAPLIRYRVIDMAARLDIDLGVPVATAVPGDDRVSSQVIPAGRYAALVYTGPYDSPELVDANAALLDWGAKQGLVWDTWSTENGDAFGARIESYLTDPDEEPDPSRWRTEVAIRLADDQPR
jgi:effector-binding domain-containing protein